MNKTLNDIELRLIWDRCCAYVNKMSDDNPEEHFYKDTFGELLNIKAWQLLQEDNK